MIPINRSALIIYPGQPIYDWANRIFNENEDYGPVDLAEHDAATVYLIEELDSPEDFEEWMQANYEVLLPGRTRRMDARRKPVAGAGRLWNVPGVVPRRVSQHGPGRRRSPIETRRGLK